MLRADLLERLERLDEDAYLLYPGEDRYRLVIVGGSALILLEVISRSTLDIDAIHASREIRCLLDRYDINCDVQTYINNFPYNYEDRLKPLPLRGKKIDFFTASLEDIVIAKLFSHRDTDRQDIIRDTVVGALDWELLDRIVRSDEEVKRNALNERNYQDFLFDYEEYVRRCRLSSPLCPGAFHDRDKLCIQAGLRGCRGQLPIKGALASVCSFHGSERSAAGRPG